MSDDTPNNENANLENILSQLSHQQNALDKLHKDYSTLTAEWLMNSAKAEAINQGHVIEKTLNEKIESTLNGIKFITAVFGLLVSTIIALLGFFGVEKFIERTIEHEFTAKMEERVVVVEKETSKKTGDLLNKSIKLYSEAHDKVNQNKNHLIVLQTDYGSESPYMGVLKGAIYHINPNARIDVITDGVPPFNTFDAAWILSKAVEYYPKNTIFVSITGDVEGASPVILRNEEKGHTFIGYLNGVFDVVKPPYGFDDKYAFDLKKLREELEERGKWPKNEQLINLRSDEILGFIAGSLSKMLAPWEQNYDKEKNFPWDDVWEKTLYTEKLGIKSPFLRSVDLQNFILIEGTIMNIDRYGNANTNIPKNYLDEQLDKKKLELNDTSTVAVGIADKAEDFSELDDLKLEPVKFSEVYSTVDKDKPLITVVNGKLQLAIKDGNFSQSGMFHVGAKIAKSRMKVWIMVEKKHLPNISINPTEGSDVETSGDTSKK